MPNDKIDIALYTYGAIMAISTIGVSISFMDLPSYIAVTGAASAALTIIMKMIKDSSCDACDYKKWYEQKTPVKDDKILG